METRNSFFDNLLGMKRIKYKYIIAVFIIGFVINLFGALQKVLHYPNADKIITVAFYIMAASAVTAVIKLIFSNHKNSFLDK
jgi:uncharacterized membrane protein YdcZ (DUF606 family)